MDAHAARRPQSPGFYFDIHSTTKAGSTRWDETWLIWHRAGDCQPVGCAGKTKTAYMLEWETGIDAALGR